MYFRFEHKEFLLAFILIPVLIIGYILFFYRKKGSLKKYGEIELLKSLMPFLSYFRQHFKFILILFAFSLIIFAMAGPQYGSRLANIKRKGIEIIIALDVSNSMLAEDIKPNRLERAKQAIYSLIEQLEDDKLGLIVFAGDAYTQIPITNDFVSAKMFLKNISPDIVTKQGTAIGTAIELSLRSFTQDTETGKVIVIISDGENHEGNTIDATKKAAENGIKIYTIGMGSIVGALIPFSEKNYQKGFFKDKEGNVVTSKMNARMLNEIAQAGGGEYFTASTSNVGLGKLFNKLRNMQKDEVESKVYSEYEEQFPYFIGVALFLLILEFMIFERKNKWLMNVSIFQNKNQNE